MLSYMQIRSSRLAHLIRLPWWYAKTDIVDYIHWPKLPQNSGIPHPFSLQYQILHFTTYASICKWGGHLRFESGALVISKKWHRKWIPCFKLLPKSDITLQFSLHGSKLTFHRCFYMQIRGRYLGFDTVAMVICKIWHC